MKAPSEKVEGYTDAELAKLYDECDEFHRVVLQFLLYTGMRFARRLT